MVLNRGQCQKNIESNTQFIWNLVKEKFKIASTTSKAIAEAVKKVEELSLNKEARREYEFREKSLKDYNSVIFDAKEEGIKKGKEEGVKEGEIKDKIEAVIAFAKTEISLKAIYQTLKIDTNIKKQVIDELDEMSIKYTEYWIRNKRPLKRRWYIIAIFLVLL